MSVYITREMSWQPENESKHRNAANILDRLVRSVTRKLKRNRTMAELRALSDWELRDIGLNREDIPTRRGDNAGRRLGASRRP